jgi:hypothetical protein
MHYYWAQRKKYTKRNNRSRYFYMTLLLLIPITFVVGVLYFVVAY